MTDVRSRPEQVDPRLVVAEHGVRGYVTAVNRRVRSGDLGSLPVIVGLAAIWVLFQQLEPNFLTSQNLSNLTLQIAATGVISVGIVLVLLLGEIDLSVGAVSGLTGAVLAVLNVREGLPAGVAIGLALLAGALIGLFHGFVFAKVGVPAFVVTLAGLIGWQGLQLRVLGSEGTINLPYDGFIAQLSLKALPDWAGLVLAALVVVVYLGASFFREARRAVAGLPSRPLPETLLRAGALAVALFAVVLVLNDFRGVPILLLIFVAVVVVFDVILRKTRYGRMIFAVGGNVEAARRAGINVAMVRITVFTIASTLAAAGGVLFASRLFSVSQSSGGNDVLLNAIAAAVIGGTSLFGGRGSTYSALLGMLVIGSITSGMLLLSVGSDVRLMVTAAVLLAAVVIDSLSRRGRQASGRA